MTREFEAIYENGVLKPDEPLPFADKERVKVKVSNGVDSAKPVNHRYEEMAWIEANAHLYKGEYVAQMGSELVSHGRDGRAVIEEARNTGFGHALFHYIPEDYGERRFELF